MGSPGSPSNSGRDEAAIRALEAAYDAAWDAGDVDGLVACFAPDAVVVNPLGEVAHGRGGIGQALGAFLAGPARGSRHTSALGRVTFVTDDVAVVDGEATLTGLAALAGGIAPPLTHRFTDVVVKRDGAWLLAHVRAYVLMAAPPDHCRPTALGPARTLEPVDGTGRGDAA